MQSLACTLAPAAAGLQHCTAHRPALASSSRPFTTQLPQRRSWQHVTRAEDDSSSEPAAQQVGAAATRHLSSATRPVYSCSVGLSAPHERPLLSPYLSQAAPPPAPQQQQQQQEEEPIWVRRERERQLQKEEGGSFDLPFGAYLLFSSFTAIAAVSALWRSAHLDACLATGGTSTPHYTAGRNRRQARLR